MLWIIVVSYFLLWNIVITKSIVIIYFSEECFIWKKSSWKKREMAKTPTYHYCSMVFNTMPIYLFYLPNTCLRHIPFGKCGNQFNFMKGHICTFVRTRKDIALSSFRFWGIGNSSYQNLIICILTFCLGSNFDLIL